jgi:alpha-glucosidase (family GH31 glycosyl hydrolase)
MSPRLSIIHTPHGTDHPYQVLPAERTPRDPVGGDMVSVGFLTTPGGVAQGVRFYWERNGRPQTPVHGRPVSVGHDNDRWLVELGVMEAGDTVCYWVIAETADGPVESPRYEFATRRRRTLAGISAVTEIADGLQLSTLARDGAPGPTLTLRQLEQAGGVQVELGAKADPGAAPQDFAALHLTALHPTALHPAALHSAPIIVGATNASIAIAPSTGWISYVANGASVPMRLRWIEEADGTLATVELSAELTDDEALVGLGERFDTLDQHGRAPDVAVYEQYKNHGNRTYLPIPFVISSRGYACLVEGTGHVAYDFGRTSPDRWTCTAQAGGGKPLAFDLFAGDPAACVGALTARTGRPAAPPPDWTFGLWMSSNEWNTQARVEREAALHAEHGIPATVLVIEAWSDENTFYIWNGAQYTPREGNWTPQLSDFTFPADGPWPNPKAMSDALHEQGIRLILWQIPALKHIEAAHPQHDADCAHAQEQGYVLRMGDGEPYRNPAFWFHQAMIPDFTSAEATAWWMQKRAYLLAEMGVDGFKTDGGEHLQGRGIVASDGRTGDELVNAYPNLYIGAYHRFAIEQRKGDAITFSRAGHTGVGAFPAHWAGDENSNWEAFRRSITAGLSAGLSGVPFWGWDIAGFSEALPTAELYLRAMAMAAFCPIMQYHSEYTAPGEPSKDRTPWRIQEHTGDERIIPLSRFFARLRMALIPYLVREAAYSAASGEPMLRALCLDYPADPASWRTSDQYLLGRDLLVAPVVYEGDTQRAVKLPSGDWYDFWSGEQLVGDQVLCVAVPLDRIPVYVRAGAILPLHLAPGQALGDDVGANTTPSHLTLRIYPAGNSTGTVVLNGETIPISASVEASGAVRVSLPPLPIPVTVTLPDGRSAAATASDQPQELRLT